LPFSVFFSTVSVARDSTTKIYTIYQFSIEYMSLNPMATVFKSVRVVLIVAGLGVGALFAHELATLPAVGPGGGVAIGLAILFGRTIIAVSLTVAVVSAVLPTLLGRDDSLGFNRRQCTTMEILSPWLVSVVSAACLVVPTLIWRLGEVVSERLSGTVGGRAS